MMTDDTTEPGATDLLAVLEAIRPLDDIDRQWDPHAQADVRERILVSAEPDNEADELGGRRRRRRSLAVLGAGALIIAGGAGAAAATGVMPDAFVNAFSYWQTSPVHGQPPVNPSNATRVASAPGPHGTRFTVLAASATNDPDYTCVAPLFETAGSAREPGPTAFTEAYANWCQQGAETAPFGSLGGVDVTKGYYVWSTSAGAAARAELRTASGQRYPVLRYRGNFFGWFPAPAAGQQHAQLTGFAANGTKIGSTRI